MQRPLFNRVMQRAVARRLAALERVADFLLAGQEAAWQRQVLHEWRELNPPGLLSSSDASDDSDDASDDSDDANLPGRRLAGRNILHHQLPASLDGTNDEHKAGTAMFYIFHYLFGMHTIKRFVDPTLLTIREKMLARTGVKFSSTEWRALQDTVLDAEQLECKPDAFEEETAGGFESSYLWSRVTMASYTCATISVDFSPQVPQRNIEVYDRMLAVPSLAHTSRLPGWVMLHLNMRVRLTTQVLPPWGVQDTTYTVMAVDLSTRNAELHRR